MKKKRWVNYLFGLTACAGSLFFVKKYLVPKNFALSLFVLAKQNIQSPGASVAGLGRAKGKHDPFDGISGQPGLDSLSEDSHAQRGVLAAARDDQHTAHAL